MQWAATGSGFGTRCPPGHQNIRYRFHPNGSVVSVRLPGGPGDPRDVGNVQYANPNGSDPPGRRNRVRLDSLVCFCRKPIILMGNKKNLHMERVLGCGSVWVQFKEPVWNRTWRKSTSRRNMSPSNRTCSGSASSKEGKALTGSWSAAFLESSAKDHQITFYEGRCFTGRKLEVRGDCDNFQDRGFMNRVNSIRVESGAWICYDHPDFRGQQYILEHGEYPEFQRWNSHNDHMGSCKPIRMHGEHYRIELFEACNFSGQCMDICDDCPFLQSRGFSKSCINSVRVYGDGAWVMYEEPNFRGRMYIVERGNYCSPTEWQAQNPNIQSIRRVVNYF